MQWAVFTLVALSSSLILVGPLLTVEQLADDIYSIMFDAGSTGTRIHIFTFRKHMNGTVELISEQFDRISPGLSSFANNPAEGAASLRPLLDNAKVFIPKKKWKETPVVLKATAGLRLLPLRTADLILEEVRKVFKEYPFQVSPNAVSIMDGIDEGIFGWFTLSFIKGQLFTPINRIGSLDLGGGSTQVTFSPSSIATAMTSPVDHIQHKHILGKGYTLYTYSYLGQGLMSARLSILNLSNKGNMEQERYSSCVHPNTTTTWLFNGVNYKVSGDRSMKYGFDLCYGYATRFLNNTIDRPAEFKKKNIFAMSYYYDRAVDSGMLKKGDSGSKLAVEDFFVAAKAACSVYDVQNPLLCLDLSYISALLHHGIGLEKSKKINVVKKIKGLEISWALGAAFSEIR